MLLINDFVKVLSLIFNCFIQSCLHINSLINICCKSYCPISFLYNIGYPFIFFSNLLFNSVSHKSYSL